MVIFFYFLVSGPRAPHTSSCCCLAGGRSNNGASHQRWYDLKTAVLRQYAVMILFIKQIWYQKLIGRYSIPALLKCLKQSNLWRHTHSHKFTLYQGFPNGSSRINEKLIINKIKCNIKIKKQAAQLFKTKLKQWSYQIAIIKSKASIS